MNEKARRWGWVVLAFLILVLSSQYFHSHPHAASNFEDQAKATLTAIQTAIPTEQLKGMAYSPFREGQSPEQGIYPTLSEVRQDMSLLNLVSNGIRTYGCRHLAACRRGSSVGFPPTMFHTICQ